MPDPITNIATADASSITVRGRDLVNDLIGKHTFTEVFYFLVTGRMPEAAQARVLDACLVTLMEHGFTPSALIARLMAESVPDQIQVSIGAGLMAIGSVHAGTMEGCAALLAAGVDETDAEAGAAASSRSIGSARRQCRVSAMRCTSRTTHARRRSCASPARTGWMGATSSSCSNSPPPSTKPPAATSPSMRPVRWRPCCSRSAFRREIVRAIAVVSRSAGLVGHILEEQQTDSARHLVRLARETIPYQDPSAS